jgi:hypothetical protein
MREQHVARPVRARSFADVGAGGAIASPAEAGRAAAVTGTEPLAPPVRA